ncbi:MAG: hypothetical protein JWN76_3428 [Chitinophagaceae bacterium]|nr:hypothetical protein [Chitinophagaceae bacterium]
MKSFWKNNSLSIVFFLLFMVSLLLQSISGWKVYNQQLYETAKLHVNYLAYLRTGHFISSTFENWESEFLQMGLYIILAVGLRQKGSSESKAINQKEDVDREPDRLRKNAPWPVRKGGIVLMLYKQSLSLAFLLLFAVSFCLHFYGSWTDYNNEQSLKHLSKASFTDYSTQARFWFESFQNWQSEFLSVFAIIILSVFLRQQGSPQSKPVDAADNATG